MHDRLVRAISNWVTLFEFEIHPGLFKTKHFLLISSPFVTFGVTWNLATVIQIFSYKYIVLLDNPLYGIVALEK